MKFYLNHVTRLDDNDVKTAIIEYVNKYAPQRFGVRYKIEDIQQIWCKNAMDGSGVLEVSLNRVVG